MPCTKRCRSMPSRRCCILRLQLRGRIDERSGQYFRNNVGGSINLLDALVAAGRARGGAPLPIVFSSTAATYGIPAADLITEEHPTKPINPYVTSKRTVESILADYGRAYGLGSVIFRYFIAAGADPAADLGEDHNPETHLIPTPSMPSPAVAPA